jgi:hypothetical protein
MSFTIRNLTAGTIAIDDLGLTLDPYEDYDLTQDDARDVAQSTDLLAAINANNILVVDPISTASPVALLSKADSLICVSVANNSHFRIIGGELAQLDDVKDTAPTDGYVLTFDAIASKWEPAAAAAGGAGGVTQFPFYRASGVLDPIPVTYVATFPFYRADGTLDLIPVDAT